MSPFHRTEEEVDRSIHRALQQGAEPEHPAEPASPPNIIQEAWGKLLSVFDKSESDEDQPDESRRQRRLEREQRRLQVESSALVLAQEKEVLDRAAVGAAD